MPDSLRPLTFIVRRDNTVIILTCGLLYLVYTCINTSMSVLFIDSYSLTKWQAGLIYLPFGIGGTVSTFFSSHLLDKAYRDAWTKRGLSVNKAVGDDLDNFSTEKARLGIIWVPMLLTACAVLASGWVLHFHRVGPLQSSFCSNHSNNINTAYCYSALPPLRDRTLHATRFQREFVHPLIPRFKEPDADNECPRSITHFCSTIITDHWPRLKPQVILYVVVCLRSSCRSCRMIVDQVGIGWTFTIMSGLYLLALGLSSLDYRYGTAWTQKSMVSLSVSDD